MFTFAMTRRTMLAGLVVAVGAVLCVCDKPVRAACDGDDVCASDPAFIQVCRRNSEGANHAKLIGAAKKARQEYVMKGGDPNAKDAPPAVLQVKGLGINGGVGGGRVFEMIDKLAVTVDEYDMVGADGQTYHVIVKSVY